MKPYSITPGTEKLIEALNNLNKTDDAVIEAIDAIWGEGSYSDESKFMKSYKDAFEAYADAIQNLLGLSVRLNLGSNSEGENNI